MKKEMITICIAVLLFPFISIGQSVWSPPGATWYYNYQSFWNEGYHKIEYVNDSLYNGQTCKVLKQSLHYRDLVSGIDYNYTMDTILTYQENNQVFFYNNTDAQFELLYDFNLLENEYWNTTGLIGDCDNYGVQFIDSVRTIDINGYNLKQQYTHHTDTSEWSFYNIIYERIGSDYAMFPEALCVIYEVVSGLRCYYDDEFGWHQFGNVDCDYITKINSISFNYPEVEIFPNPALNIINIRIGSFKKATIKLFDCSGKEVFSTLINNDSAINIDKFQSGIYMIKVESEGNLITRKILIQ